MSSNYAISGLNSYASDPYALYALNSYNPNFMAYMQQAAAQQTATQTATQSSTNGGTTQTLQQNTGSTSVDPTFKGSASASKNSGLGLGTIAAGMAVIGGTAASIYAFKRGKKEGFEGLKAVTEGFKSWLGYGAKAAASSADDAAKNVSNILKNGGKNLQEYTIQKDGMSFIMKNGKPVKIITQDKKVIDKAKDVTDYLSKNPSIKTEINKLNLFGSKLPEGVNLTYTKEIADGKNTYRLTVENGKVIKASSKKSSKNKDDKWIEIAEDQFEGFIKNHAKQVKEAETLQKTFNRKKVQVLDKHGKLVTQTGNVQISVRNGEAVSAKFNGRDLKPEELKALQKDFSAEIQNFGKEVGSTYDSKFSEYGYTYRQKGGQTIHFDSSKNITRIDAVTQNEITNSDAMRSWLEKNSGIKSELDNIVSTGAISDGYRLGHLTYKDDAGRIFEIHNNKINRVKLDKKITLCGKTFNAGDVIYGKYLVEWRKTAENGNAYNEVLAMLK